MCRLFGSRSLKPGGVAHALLRGSNALREQSREHPDGWGLAWYVGGEPQLARSLAPAHADDDFAEVVGGAGSAAARAFVEADTVLAHIRKASVGRVALENTHPFQRGRWVFAHNGTLPHWERCAGALESLLEPSLRRSLRGETDSERCFLLFLTQLARLGEVERPGFAKAAQALRATVAAVVRTTAALAAEASEPEPRASTTFLLTDGQLMIACRSGRPLQLSAPPADPSGRVPWFAVSSEDPTGKAQAGGERAAFREVPDSAIVGVDAELGLHHERL